MLAILLGISFFIGTVALWIIAVTKIAGKAGYHPALGLLVCSPYINIILIIIFAFSKWPIYDYLDKDKVKPHKPLSKLALIFIIIGGALPIIALLAVIAIPNFLRARISANDSLAQSTLRAMATATETYSTANKGYYPTSMEALINSNPPYIKNNYCNQTVSGYYYECYTSKDKYVFTATSVTLGTSGSTTYTMKSGGVLSQ